MVTGATKGIGRAVVEIFAKNGHNLAICSRNNQELQELANRLKLAYGVNVYYEQCDVADKSDVEMFAENALAEFGHFDVLINNAGVFMPGAILAEEHETFETMLNTNLVSAYTLTKLIVPYMVIKKSGHVFNICSTASIKAYPNGGSYCISKFALYGMTKVLREELMETGVKVTAILPGPTYSASWHSANIPKERFMMAEEVAQAVYAAFAMPGNAVFEDIVMRPQLGDI
ncbi:MAG: SDR family oxidoreductase [Bacteroidetes bacterium]|nr:SDR family oxidoreductase [Bacteroidota bacterium]